MNLTRLLTLILVSFVVCGLDWCVSLPILANTNHHTLTDLNIDVGIGHPFVTFEHVNINVGDEWNIDFDMFYFDALGFVRDTRAPGVLQRTIDAGGTAKGLQWANIGLQQLHLPYEPVQRVRGYIGLVYPDLDAVTKRLRANGIRFTDHYPRVSSATDTSSDSQVEIGRYLETHCPVGNEFRIHAQQGCTLHEGESMNMEVISGTGVAHTPSSSSSSSSAAAAAAAAYIRSTLDDNSKETWYGPVEVLPPSEEYQLPGGRSLGLGIQYVSFHCPTHTAEKICRFYRHFFKSPGAYTDVDPVTLRKFCRVPVGIRQYIQYTELYPTGTGTGGTDDQTATATVAATVTDTSDIDSEIDAASNCDSALPAYDGHHIALYVNDFSAIYQRVQSHNLHWDNPRFPQFTYRTLDDALHHNEFRVKDIIDLDTNETIYTIEHEIRSLRHPSFCCQWLLPSVPASTPTASLTIAEG